MEKIEGLSKIGWGESGKKWKGASCSSYIGHQTLGPSIGHQALDPSIGHQ